MKARILYKDENPVLVRDILVYLARRAGGRPVTIEELQHRLYDPGGDDHASFDSIRDQIGVMIQLDLVEIHDWLRRQSGSLDDENAWADTLDVSLSGLTQRGRKYVQQATANTWKAVYEEIKLSGQAPTTAILIERLDGILSG